MKLGALLNPFKGKKSAEENSKEIEMLHNMFIRREMRKISSIRQAKIAKEFKNGFKFIEDYSKSVTFFGSTRFSADSPQCLDAQTLASRIVTELGHSVVTGGGPGIMEAANRGAFEAGGKSLGHLIELPDGQPINNYLTASVSYHYFFARKVMLGFSAEAYIFYPGGFGTLDEFFEILTLIQTRKIKSVPLICVGTEYWSSLREFMQKEMTSRGAIIEKELSLFHITDSHDYILEILKNVPVKDSDPLVPAAAPAEALKAEAQTV